MRRGQKILLGLIPAVLFLLLLGRSATDWKGRIAGLKKTVPRDYEAYCTEETSAALSRALADADAALEGGAADPGALVSALSDSIRGLEYRWDSEIPQVYLSTDDGSGRPYGTSLDKSHGYVPAQITVVDEQGKVIASETGWDAAVRVRGNTTAQGEKKPYNIRFSAARDLFGLGEARRWVLLADLYDPTLMRNVLALDFGKYLGVHASPDFQRVEVWMDGVYRGLYLLTEKIEKGRDRVDLITKKGSGDFLAEMVYAELREEGNTYFFTSSGKCFRLREPEDVSAAKLSLIAGEMDDLEAVLASGDWKLVSGTIDVDSFVSHYIQNEFFKTTDFSSTSVYFHRMGGRYYGGPGWDFDLSAGNCSAKIYGEEMASPEGAAAADCHYYADLMRYPEFRERVREKYLEAKAYIAGLYRAGGLIDQQAEKYGGAIARNNEVWFRGKKGYIKWQKKPEATYGENLEYLREWMKQRDLWLTDYFESLGEKGGA